MNGMCEPRIDSVRQRKAGALACTRISFLTRMVESCSPSRLCPSTESTSSKKITDGLRARDTPNRARTSRSESPIHL
eukprot:scaffold33975_cov67-Isochrysis_galbana.AAC.1